ncbi:hypothetical protein B0T26DRAFT_794390 [Lasiosphaeria miniovina]|uniref:Uncharacterized protein n=1 Tax=Lasiosphaeria miniovina TaxID=1954250 RepID=A0AA39ZUS7_9PEZI|nr:uncharacterized protein B0T26DRAFT_794390 [Lasiosphaeria miniovina]KAK0703930.1 hypothetical protein B0T26DRAFT_794390 [Lasiosphaeria miniovina]
MYQTRDLPFKLDSVPEPSNRIIARDARAQQSRLPKDSGTPFMNYEGLNLRTPDGVPIGRGDDDALLHSPLLMAGSEPWTPGQPRGVARTVYAEDDPRRFDVMYHDPDKADTGTRGNNAFSRATYHPASAATSGKAELNRRLPPAQADEKRWPRRRDSKL